MQFSGTLFDYITITHFWQPIDFPDSCKGPKAPLKFHNLCLIRWVVRICSVSTSRRRLRWSVSRYLQRQLWRITDIWRATQTSFKNNSNQTHFQLRKTRLWHSLWGKKSEGKTYATLQLFLSAFSWYCRRRNEDNVIMSISFKAFKSGLKRVMTGARHPFQKEPFRVEFFPLLHESMNLSTAGDRLLFLLMLLYFHFFMRIGEICELKVRNLFADTENQRLQCHFEKTKADQFALGVTSFIPIREGILNPVQYMDVLSECEPTAKVCRWSKPALQSRLRWRLSAIGVENASSYSWHSFGRGDAARLASERGVQDCVIKKHGRWNSEAYLSMWPCALSELEKRSSTD